MKKAPLVPPGVRPIRKVFRSRPTIEGAGVHLRRAIGWGDPSLFDPFLLLDDFRSDVPSQYLAGFPWHPHRGIETITYVLAGTVAHGDSLGNSGVIAPGDVQWMTAGRGIIHQEMPKGDGAGSMHGFQLWANLPAAHKMTGPRYRGVVAGEIPEARGREGWSARVIAGEAEGVRGPVRDVLASPQYLDVSVPAGGRFDHPAPRGHTAFAYVIGGEGTFSPQADPFSYEAEGEGYFDTERGPLLGDRHLVLFGEGERVEVRAGKKPLRFLFVSGKPWGEPIAWYGPIVMNTREELETAYRELGEGTFLGHVGGEG